MHFDNILNQVFENPSVYVQAGVSPIIDISGCQIVSYTSSVTVVAQAPTVFASTAVNTTTNAINVNSHGLVTGEIFQLTTTGTLPTGLSLATNYFVIVVDVNNFKVASSLVNANAGTAIVLSTQGSGNDTMTFTALATSSLTWQSSLDGLLWNTIGSANTITVTANFSNTDANPGYRFLRLSYALASGRLSSVSTILGKGLR